MERPRGSWPCRWTRRRAWSPWSSSCAWPETCTSEASCSSWWRKSVSFLCCPEGKEWSPGLHLCAQATPSFTFVSSQSFAMWRPRGQRLTVKGTRRAGREGNCLETSWRRSLSSADGVYAPLLHSSDSRGVFQEVSPFKIRVQTFCYKCFEMTSRVLYRKRMFTL